MKIAVLLFGHLRTFEYCAPFLRANLLDKYNCDVFMHTWDTFDSETLAWYNRTDKTTKISDDILQKIKELFNPKKIEIGHQVIKKETIIKSLIDDKKNSLNGMLFMFQSMNCANSLRKQYEKETGIKYDIVIVTRPDVALFNFLNIEKILKESKIMNLDLNKTRFFAGLYGAADTNVGLIISRISDILFFGKPKVIDKYILSNSNITKEYAKKHFLNITSIYSSNEIKAGIIPVQICFEYVKDWRNIKPQDLIPATQNKKTHNSLYKFFHFYWLRGKK